VGVKIYSVHLTDTFGRRNYKLHADIFAEILVAKTPYVIGIYSHYLKKYLCPCVNILN
jgi:hypothetical protein